MEAGLGVLRLAPAAFWAMTPRELAAALGHSRASTTLARADLTQLMARFPDGAAG